MPAHAGVWRTPKVASERLGHSKVGITLDLYSHVMPGMQDDAVAKVDAALKAAQRKPRVPQIRWNSRGPCRSPFAFLTYQRSIAGRTQSGTDGEQNCHRF